METSVTDLKKMACGLAGEYNQDLNRLELCSETETTKFNY